MSSLVTAITLGRAGFSQPGLRQTLRRLVGPGLLVAVGYIDPGNWATDIAGGTGFGYSLLAVVVISSLLAMAIQSLVVRVTVATGEDLASLTGRLLPRPVAVLSWAAGEAAILATALAELVGGAIALRLLFALPLQAGLAVTALGTIAVMLVSRGHAGLQEKLVNLLIAVVALSFVALLIAARPDAGAMVRDVAHAAPLLLQDHGALLISLGILGATIMPHNLYLHSGLLAERLRDMPGPTRGAAGAALRTATGDTVLSLSLAMLVNGAILVVAAASLTGGTVAIASLDEAHEAMRLVLGGAMATVFATALYAAGQSSAITGVLAGRILTRGFRGRESRTWLRGIITRVIAVAIGFVLTTQRGGESPDTLLVLSQVVLSLALPFALVPLVAIAARRQVMGRFALHPAAVLAAAAITALIVGLDLYLLRAAIAG
ncbi:MAG TPA: Nramp family divalent metal transporter [Ferrovibrio sp.]|jgi:manganese transport protein|uniref:Nramp family divalent metal transporter n=1 Tax=Ferrovibrio sp. TaxID=1917215 RepID=UPI002ED05423